MPSYLVTGVSSGIGLELCKQLAKRGDKVYGTCRKKTSSLTNEDNVSVLAGDVTVLEDIDVTHDDVGEKLIKALDGVTLDVIIHNAGSLNGTRDLNSMGELFGDQSLANVSMERMKAAFEVNTLGPLRVQQALTPLMKSPGGKVAIVSTGFASISDNSSGGVYAYRASKAAVNMVGKSMACDYKKDDKGIAVVLIAPGMVATEFGPGKEAMAKMGASTVEQASSGIIKCIDDLTMETTGKFWGVETKGGALKENAY